VRKAERGVLSRSWWSGDVRSLLSTDADSILGHLARHAGGDVVQEQIEAWRVEIEILRSQLGGCSGCVLLEFVIPRMGRRVDAIVLVGPIVFAVEFKVGSSRFEPAAIEQVWDYALDLKNFHKASHDLPIVPILIATEATSAPSAVLRQDPDGVYHPVLAICSSLHETIERVLQSDCHRVLIDPETWQTAPYEPTPTIIEAARALYAQHSVHEIARHDAGTQNLGVTSQHLESLIDEARRQRKKTICFVTGVPGAGKTLVGLNVATQLHAGESSAAAVYLSGNGPLVAVLREALTRDEVTRRRRLGEKQVFKTQVGARVKAFIQNVHHFRDEALLDEVAPPHEHVAIFDEAQRAWNATMTSQFMRRKKGVPNFSKSEPEFLLSYMDRHDWAVVVCLVGGGQEINTGEAGIDAWLAAVQGRFPGWRMHISSRLTDSEFATGAALDLARRMPGVSFDDCLHLAVSMRSFRAENVSAFVKALLDRDAVEAERFFGELAARYPVVVTRNLETAKDWVRGRARGSERYGLLTSSKALRLKPHAIDVRAKVDPVTWFLNGRDDPRSSYYLEDAATEFQVQGLELDWTCVAWDADLRVAGAGWNYHDFRGDRWLNVRSPENRRYLLNAYRVLLTRARQGMAIFVPEGSRRDRTRDPAYYDTVHDYLREVGIPSL
jgi:hypothetical protein